MKRIILLTLLTLVTLGLRAFDCEHSLEFQEYVPPTCMKKGYVENYYCFYCGQHFSDNTATEVIDGEIPALGHYLVDGQCKNTGCNLKGTELHLGPQHISLKACKDIDINDGWLFFEDVADKSNIFYVNPEVNGWVFLKATSTIDILCCTHNPTGDGTSGLLRDISNGTVLLYIQAGGQMLIALSPLQDTELDLLIGIRHEDPCSEHLELVKGEIFCEKIGQGDYYICTLCQEKYANAAATSKNWEYNENYPKGHHCENGVCTRCGETYRVIPMGGSLIDIEESSTFDPLILNKEHPNLYLIQPCYGVTLSYPSDLNIYIYRPLVTKNPNYAGGTSGYYFSYSYDESVLIYLCGNDQHARKDVPIYFGKEIPYDLNHDEHYSVSDITMMTQYFNAPYAKTLEKDYVDLGTEALWAKTNFGAASPTAPGKFVTWGRLDEWLKGDLEDEENGEHFDEQYKYYKGSNQELDDEDDIVRVSTNDEWRIPTYNEIRALVSDCQWEWTESYQGVEAQGYIVYRKSSDADHVYSTDTDDHIFLPWVGYYKTEDDKEVFNKDVSPYWSSNKFKMQPQAHALTLTLKTTGATTGTNYRNDCRLPIRPVRVTDGQ